MSDTRPVIAHVLHRLSLAGAEVLASALSRQLCERYRFVFFCLDDVGPLGQVLGDEGFEVISLGRRPGIDLRVARRLARAARRCQVDLLHAHQYTPFFYAAVSRGFGRQPRLLFTEHGRHYPDVRKVKRVWANHFLFRDDDRATAVGQFVKRALVRCEGLDRQRIEVIYNGIDPRMFAPDPAIRAAVRTELNLHDDQIALFHVARFHAVKDHATAIHAFALAHDVCPHARLFLVGDGEHRAAMEQAAWDHGVADHCCFLGVREDVSRLLQGADLFLLSSLSEGISVTLLEAMANHLPIAATDVGGNSEVVEHGHTGLLSPRQDARAMAQNLITLMSHAVMRNQMGDAGHARLLTRFTQQQMHRAYASLYEDMLA